MIAKEVYKKLLNNGLTIAFSESMSGGALAFEMVKNEGASQVIKGSLIAYSRKIKHDILGITYEDMDTFGTVSDVIASHMAQATEKLFESDVSVAITGNAGFSFEPKSGERMAHIAIRYQAQNHVFEIPFGNLSRIKAIKKTRDYTYQKILKILG
jgi:nicotinamide-nucleotide amidase